MYIYVCVYMYIYIYICICLKSRLGEKSPNFLILTAGPRHSTDSSEWGAPASEGSRGLALHADIPVSAKKHFCKPLPCNPAAETALHPLIWWF